MLKIFEIIEPNTSKRKFNLKNCDFFFKSVHSVGGGHSDYSPCVPNEPSYATVCINIITADIRTSLTDQVLVTTQVRQVACDTVAKRMWEHPTCSETVLSMQCQQPSTGSRSPYHSYKLCLLTSHGASSPAVALDESRPVQISNSIHC